MRKEFKMNVSDIKKRICDLKVVKFDDLNMDEIYGGVEPFSDEGFALFKDYVEKNNAYYYGRTDGNFDLFEAFKLAIENGSEMLIIENLS
jgi:hypothetical protein